MYLYFLQNRKKIINKINSLVILFIHNLLKDGIKFIKRWDQMFSCQEKLESHFSYTFFFQMTVNSTVQSELRRPFISSPFL